MPKLEAYRGRRHPCASLTRDIRLSQKRYRFSQGPPLYIQNNQCRPRCQASRKHLPVASQVQIRILVLHRPRGCESSRRQEMGRLGLCTPDSSGASRLSSPMLFKPLWLSLLPPRVPRLQQVNSYRNGVDRHLGDIGQQSHCVFCVGCKGNHPAPVSSNCKSCAFSPYLPVFSRFCVLCSPSFHLCFVQTWVPKPVVCSLVLFFWVKAFLFQSAGSNNNHFPASTHKLGLVALFELP